MNGKPGLFNIWVVLSIMAALVMMFPNTGQSAAPDRKALVIGNSNYKNSPLDNPVNDAEAMSKVLTEAGFQVTKLTDQSQSEMKKAIDKFGRSLKKGGVALFYFAGHGMQVKGHNYLIPVQTGIQSEEDVEYEAVRADRILAKMESAGTSVNIVILDACRNNPFARSFRSASQGLAHMDAPGGTIIAYATAPGSTAADGEGDNGLYTSQLIQHIRTPGLTIEDVFKRVRAGVRKASNKKQTPWESSSLIGNFYFTEGTAGATAPATAPKAAADQPTGPRVVASRALVGGVIVISNVDGAVFNLAGREFKTQKNQEMTIDQVPAGPQTIVARKDGFNPFQTTITVEPDQKAKLDIYMTKKGGDQPKTASLPKTTTPAPVQPPRDLKYEPDSGATEGYKRAQDAVMGFSVEVPSSWTVNNMEEMGDRIIIAISPDQNVAFRVRGFPVAPGVNLAQIRTVFENLLQQNMLNQTGQTMNMQEEQLNGMQGITALYTGRINNGVQVNIMAFFTIQGNRGYIIWTIMPSNLFQQRLPEILAMAQTFDEGLR